ncbi:hypothetical protein FOA52_008219, partial [Chlamydomonas sp. UWO 241]
VITNPDLVHVDQLMACILTMSARCEDGIEVMLHLLRSAKGAEMYLRKPELLNVPLGEPVSFALIAEQARLANETAIGLRLANGLPIMAPLPDMQLVLTPGDRVVVFAEDMAVTKARK